MKVITHRATILRIPEALRTMRPSRSCFRIIIWLFLFLWLPPLGEAWPQSTARHLRIGYSAVDVSYMPVWFAREEGLYQRHGLDVELLYIPGGPTLIQALVAGELGAAASGGSSAVLAGAGGGPVKIVLSFNNVLPYEIFAARREKRLILQIKDLRGKKVGVARRGSESESVIRLLLNRFAINPDDVTFFQVGGGGERLAALERGSIDATAMALPLNLKARKLGFPMIATVMNENIDWVHSVLAMNRAFIDQNPGVAEDIVKTIIEATGAAVKNKTAAKRVIAKYLNIEEEDILEGAYRYFQDLYVRDFYPSTAGVQRVLDELSLVRPDVKGTKPDGVIDVAILKRLHKG